MPEWDVSQVTDAQDLFAGKSSFHQAITGWTFAQGANTAGMFTGADAWLAHSTRIDGMNSTDGPPSQWNFTDCLENERVESKLCVACRIGWVRSAGDDPYKENTAFSLTFPSEGPHVYLAASAETTCAVSMAGEMKCWGQNNYGQLGYGDTSRRGDSAGEMGDALPILDFGGSSLAVKVKSLSVGFEHSCAILNDGGLRCWGRNANGQLGYGDTDNRGELPTSMGKNLPAVDLGSGRSAKFIATGHYHTCVILDDGGMKCWGRNDNGQLGYGEELPGSMGDNLPAVDLGPGQSAKFIALGADHTCVILGDGGVKCWGGNGYGQLGYGNTNNYNSGGSLAAVHFSPTVKTVAAGNSRTCVMLYGGSVKCWGLNDNGQLGYGDTNLEELPRVDGRQLTRGGLWVWSIGKVHRHR